MRKITLGDKEITLLTQLEKAEELGVLPREIRRRLVKGKISKNQIAQIPGSSKIWYLPEGAVYAQN